MIPTELCRWCGTDGNKPMQLHIDGYRYHRGCKPKPDAPERIDAVIRQLESALTEARELKRELTKERV